MALAYIKFILQDAFVEQWFFLYSYVKLRWKTIWVIKDLITDQGRCIVQPALIVGWNVKFPLILLKEDQFTAENAIKNIDDIKDTFFNWNFYHPLVIEISFY